MCSQQPQQPSDVLCLGRLLLLDCTDREWPGRRHFQLDWRTATVLTVAVQRTMAARALGRTAYDASQLSPTKSASAVVRRSRTSSRARATADLRAQLQQRSALRRARLHGIRTTAKYSTDIARVARHGNCQIFSSTRLAFRAGGRMMAVFRFQQRCKSLLKTGSDEDVDADGRSSRACL